MITPPWSGFPSSIARQPKRVPQPNDTSSESSRRDVSNADFLAPTLLQLWRCRARKIGPGECNSLYTVIVYGSGFNNLMARGQRHPNFLPSTKRFGLGYSYVLLLPVTSIKRSSRSVQQMHPPCIATNAPPPPAPLLRCCSSLPPDLISAPRRPRAPPSHSPGCA